MTLIPEIGDYYINAGTYFCYWHTWNSIDLSHHVFIMFLFFYIRLIHYREVYVFKYFYSTHSTHSSFHSCSHYSILQPVTQQIVEKQKLVSRRCKVWEIEETLSDLSRNIRVAKCDFNPHLTIHCLQILLFKMFEIVLYKSYTSLKIVLINTN